MSMHKEAISLLSLLLRRYCGHRKNCMTRNLASNSFAKLLDLELLEMRPAVSCQPQHVLLAECYGHGGCNPTF